MINEKTLTEKLKYLIMSETRGQFDILDFYVDFIWNDDKTLDSYEVSINFDYKGTIDADIRDFTEDIYKMSNKLHEILKQYVVDRNGNLISGESSDAFVGEGAIWKMDFATDEKHLFNMSFMINHWG